MVSTATAPQITGERTIAKSKSDYSDSLIESVCRRIAKDQRVRRTLPGKGRLHIDRQVPFLCVYRQPPEHEDAGTEQLVKGEASYMIASGCPEHHAGTLETRSRSRRNIVDAVRCVPDRRTLGCT